MNEFSVYQFLIEDIIEKVRDNVSAEEAVKAAFHYTHNVATTMGITERVIIVDSSDSVVFEWLKDKGIVFPPDLAKEQA